MKIVVHWKLGDGSCHINGIENVMNQKVQHSNKWSLKCRTIVIVFKGARNLKKKTEEFAKWGSQTGGRKRISLSKSKATCKTQKNGNTAQFIQI